MTIISIFDFDSQKTLAVQDVFKVQWKHVQKKENILNIVTNVEIYLKYTPPPKHLQILYSEGTVSGESFLGSVSVLEGPDVCLIQCDHYDCSDRFVANLMVSIEGGRHSRSVWQ